MFRRSTTEGKIGIMKFMDTNQQERARVHL